MAINKCQTIFNFLKTSILPLIVLFIFVLTGCTPEAVKTITSSLTDKTDKITSLSGEVTDSKTSKPIAGATVEIDGKAINTNDNGVYKLENIKEGEYKIIVLKNGYNRLSETVNISGKKVKDFSLVSEERATQTSTVVTSTPTLIITPIPIQTILSPPVTVLPTIIPTPIIPNPIFTPTPIATPIATPSVNSRQIPDETTIKQKIKNYFNNTLRYSNEYYGWYKGMEMNYIISISIINIKDSSFEVCTTYRYTTSYKSDTTTESFIFEYNSDKFEWVIGRVSPCEAI